MIEKKKVITKEKLYFKLASYCAYQERCMQDIEKQIDKYEISPTDRDELIGNLFAEKYIDELRYARSVARGKFSFRSWGKVKIRFYLRTKGIADTYISKALLEINTQTYKERCAYLVEKQREKLASKELDSFTENQKILSSLTQKGYEFEVIKELL